MAASIRHLVDHYFLFLDVPVLKLIINIIIIIIVIITIIIIIIITIIIIIIVPTNLK